MTRADLEKKYGRKLTEIEYQMLNWYYFTWICGDHIAEQHIHTDLVIPDKDAPVRKGAIAPWAKSSSPYYIQTLEALAKLRTERPARGPASGR